MNRPFVSIIIANYNGEEYLETCLSSVIKSSYKNFEIILIDDCSRDGSIGIIKEFASLDNRIKFIVNKKNLGAAASRNKAIRIALGEVLVFLDNDTEVDSSWLTELLKLLKQNSQIGAVQAKLMDFNNRDTVQNAGVKLWSATGWGLPVYNTKQDETKLKDELSIIAISAALAVQKEVILSCGGFDEFQSIATEDLDLSWRIWLLGYEIKLASKSIVYHWTKNINMRSNMKHSNEKIYFHLAKNSLISILKNYELFNALKYAIFCLIILMGRGLLVFIRRKDSSALRGSIRGIFWSVGHLGSIYHMRKQIQMTRRNSDQYLFNKVITKGSLLTIYKKYYNKSDLLN